MPSCLCNNARIELLRKRLPSCVGHRMKTSRTLLNLLDVLCTCAIIPNEITHSLIVNSVVLYYLASCVKFV